MRTLSVIVTAAAMLLALMSASPPEEISERAVPGGIEVLGWEDSTARIYYMVTQPHAAGDSIRYLRRYETKIGSKQQPQTEMSACLQCPAERVAALRSRLKELRSSLIPMTTVVPPESVKVRRTRDRQVQVEDMLMTVADHRVEFEGLAGAWETYDVCHEPMNLVVRRLHLVPEKGLGLAIIQSQRSAGCEFTRVVLISTQAVRSLHNEWTQVP